MPLRTRPVRHWTEKAVPDSDREFANMARAFAQNIASDPGRFKMTADESAFLTRRVREYRDALAKWLSPSTKTKCTMKDKDEARQRLEGLVRACRNYIRGQYNIEQTSFSVVNPTDRTDLCRSDMVAVGIDEKPRKLKQRKVPMTPPYLQFERSTSGEAGMGSARHVLRCKDEFATSKRAKPPGAVRLELFVELVPDGEPIPKSPTERSGGRLWYLRSFTTSRMEVEFPVSSVPMMVVYWGRWADTRGNVGPFSPTCVARVEGGWGAVNLIESRDGRKTLGTSQVQLQQVETKYFVVQPPYALPERLDCDDLTRALRMLPEAVRSTQAQLPGADCAQ